MEGSAPITWSVLLAKWTSFAQASAALPDTPHGKAWKAAVPSIIALQAVTMALMEVAQHKAAGNVEPSEVALACDKGSVLVKQHAAVLEALWTAPERPDAVSELIDDARAAVGGLEAP